NANEAAAVGNFNVIDWGLIGDRFYRLDSQIEKLDIAIKAYYLSIRVAQIRKKLKAKIGT
ncbi:MAG: hypothetical protein AAFW67_09005, partial [Cyanobacteria bacterium J06638_38]